MTETTTQVAEYQPSAAALAELKNKYQGIVFDVATTRGDEAARAARLELVKTRTALEKRRSELKRPIMDRALLLDTEAKRLTQEILALEEPISAQVKEGERIREEKRKAKEAAERARIEGIQAKIRGIRGFADAATTCSDSTGIKHLWSQLFRSTVEAAEYEEFVEAAALARTETLAALLAHYRSREAAEEEAKRLRLEREELDRQRAEQERIAEEQRAAQAKLDAEAARLEQAKLEREEADKRFGQPHHGHGPTLGEAIGMLREAATAVGHTGPLSSEAVLKGYDEPIGDLDGRVVPNERGGLDIQSVNPEREAAKTVPRAVDMAQAIADAYGVHVDIAIYWISKTDWSVL